MPQTSAPMACCLSMAVHSARMKVTPVSLRMGRRCKGAKPSNLNVPLPLLKQLQHAAQAAPYLSRSAYMLLPGRSMLSSWASATGEPSATAQSCRASRYSGQSLSRKPGLLRHTNCIKVHTPRTMHCSSGHWVQSTHKLPAAGPFAAHLTSSMHMFRLCTSERSSSKR